MKYFNKAKRLNSSNSFNSLGLIILNGDFPHIKKNKEKARKYFEKSIELGNVYGFNNLGKIEEENKNYKKALEYYMMAADKGESWAANKVGEFLRRGIGTKKDEKKAYMYYSISSESSQLTLCRYSILNLVKYYYEEGNLEANIEKDISKSISLLEEIENELYEALVELFIIYYKLYISDKENIYYYNKMMEYKNKCENRKEYNKKYKNEIESRLKNIKNKIDKINLP